MSRGVRSLHAVLVGALVLGLPVSAVAIGVTASAPPDGQGGVSIELVDALGSGGQLEGRTREVVIGDERFLFDRVVPVNPGDLIAIAQEQGTAVYATTDVRPFPAIYLAAPGGGPGLARYLPEAVGTGGLCPADAANYAPVEA